MAARVVAMLCCAGCPATSQPRWSRCARHRVLCPCTPTMRWCGPHSSSYSTGCSGTSLRATLVCWWGAAEVDGKQSNSQPLSVLRTVTLMGAVLVMDCWCKSWSVCIGQGIRQATREQWYCGGVQKELEMYLIPPVSWSSCTKVPKEPSLQKRGKPSFTQFLGWIAKSAEFQCV